MTTYTTIADTEIDAESPIDECLMQSLRDNPIAITEGASGAPTFAAASMSTVTNERPATTDAIADGAVSDIKIDSGNITLAKLDAAVLAQLVTNGNSHNHSAGDGYPIYSYLQIASNSLAINSKLYLYMSSLLLSTGTIDILSGTQRTIATGFFNFVVGSSSDEDKADLEIQTTTGNWYGRDNPSGLCWSDGTNLRLNNRSGGHVYLYWQKMYGSGSP